MNRLPAPKKQTQFKPNSKPIKACPERSEFTLSVIEGNGPISSKAKMNLISFIRLMRRCIRQIRALELPGEKNRLGRGSD